MTDSGFQKLTKNGHPVVHKDTGLPVYNKPDINYRLKAIKNIITIGMNESDARWWGIQHDINKPKPIGFNNHHNGSTNIHTK